jgi:hypothetical protein
MRSRKENAHRSLAVSLVVLLGRGRALIMTILCLAWPARARLTACAAAYILCSKASAEQVISDAPRASSGPNLTLSTRSFGPRSVESGIYQGV